MQDDQGNQASAAPGDPLADAAARLRKALEVDPNNATLWAELGAAEHQRGNPAAAEEAYQRSLSHNPNHTQTLANYGFLLSQMGQAAKAVALLEPALDDTPAAASAWLVLGLAHWALQDLTNAESAIRRALALDPGNIVARINLAAVLRVNAKLTESAQCCREVLATHPQMAKVWSVLASAQLAIGEPSAAVDSYRRSIELEPDVQRHSSMLSALQYVPEVEPTQLKAAHVAWNDAYARQGLPTAPLAVRRGRRPLRVGLVSSQFRQSPIAFLALPVLEALDKSECAVVCYSDPAPEDAYTIRFQRAAAAWRSTALLSADQLAVQIRQDEIDVLVDLMGHTGQRLPVFARKPAPLQLSWLGYVGTTGVAAMDGLVADQIHVCPGEETHYVEQVWRMPNAYACYAPPPNSPAVGPLPALANGYLTFGCFNNPAKLSAVMVDAWCAILASVPNSRLLLKYEGLNDQGLQARLSHEFSRRGIDVQRVTLEGRSDHHDLLATYNRVDLALDTQPYSGGLTTCEALWMGVPVITFPGRTFAGRHSASYLTYVGLPQFLVRSLDRYIECAVTWARHPEALAAIRASLRNQLAHSPLCDAPRFAADFLSLVRQQYERRASI